MKQILTVFSYTFRDGARKKAFIVSTVIMLVLILILSLIPGIVSFFSSDDVDVTETSENVQVETSSDLCYYCDDNGLIPDGETVLRQATGYEVLRITSDEIVRCREEIAENSRIAMITVDERDGLPWITVVTKDFMSGFDASYLASVLSQTYIAETLEAQGISSDVIAFAQSQLPYSVEAAGEMNISGYILGIVLTMLIFFAVYYYGYGVSMSVATEKTSRVMETLIVSAKPSRILIGKCLAMGILGLCQFVGVLLFGVLCINLFMPDGMQLDGLDLSLSSFTVETALLITLYFLLGYALYAVMNAVCGASVSKIEDLNSAMMPVMMLAMISFYVAYFAAIMPSGDGAVERIAMYIPFCSPFIMPFQLLNGDVTTADILISVALLLVSIVIVAWISIRIYSASVLHYGKRLKLKDAYRMKL